MTARQKSSSSVADAEFRYSDLLPTGQDDTPYRLITTERVSTFEANGRTFLQVDPEALSLLTAGWQALLLLLPLRRGLPWRGGSP